MVRLSESKRKNINRNSSKGNQLKWFDENIWYKADYLGYEALAEYIVSQLLKQTTIWKYVKYDIVPIEYKGKNYIGCKSENFLKEDQELITLIKLFRKYKGIELQETIARMELEERIRFVVEGVKEITGLDEFGKYLTMLLEMDTIFLNEDRHLNNIAVLQNADGTFEYCPVFDNGAALFSDTTLMFEMGTPIEKCFRQIEAKPFNRSFEEQMFAAEELYGVQFMIWFTEKDVEEKLNSVRAFYSEKEIRRVIETIREQLYKYKYLQKKNS